MDINTDYDDSFYTDSINNSIIIPDNYRLFNSTSPSINIIIINTPPSYYYVPNYVYNQYTIPQMASPAPYNYFNSTYPISIPQVNFYNPLNNSKSEKKKSHDKHKTKKSNKLTKTNKKSKSTGKSQIDCSEGLFRYLFDKYKQNPITIGIVSINGNSYNEDWKTELPNIIDPSFESYWLPKITEERFFEIEFKTFSMKISKYRLRVGDETGMFLFKSWILTGRTKKGDEVVLDNVNDCAEIQKSHPYTIKQIDSKVFVNSIKLSIKGTNEKGSLTVDMRNIELFGFLKYNDDK